MSISIIKSNKVHSDIKLKELKQDWYEVEEDITYNIFGGKLIVPKGFQTDLASIPSAFQNVIPKCGLYNASAILHDYLYSAESIYGINKSDSDIIFYEVMLNCGVDIKLAQLMYQAVKIGGESHYVKNKNNGDKTVEKRALIDYSSEYVKYNKKLKTILPNFR